MLFVKYNLGDELGGNLVRWGFELGKIWSESEDTLLQKGLLICDVMMKIIPRTVPKWCKKKKSQK